MDSLKYFPFYFNRFADGVRGYSMEFIGIYIMLLCRQAEMNRIPNDLPKLSRWMGGVSIKKIENVLNDKFIFDNDGFYNDTLQTVIYEVLSKSESARKSANSRWNNMRTQCERNANASETHPKSDANDMLIKERKEKKRKGKEIKEKENKEILVNKFTPPQLFEVVNYFSSKGILSDVEANMFFNHFTSNGWKVSGKTPMKDWNAAANNWIARSKEFINTQNGKRKSNQPATIDQVAAAFSTPPVFVNLGDFSNISRHKDQGSE